MKALVLGGGMVGSAMAMDLARAPEHRVMVADQRPEVLDEIGQRFGVGTVVADLSDPAAVTRLARGHDVVLGALSSVLGLQTLRAVIEAGTDCVDISFMAEDPRVLSPLAEERGVTVVYDCGVAPGMSNMLCGWASAHLQPCERLEILVGGLPVERRWPWEYKAGFAPHDVLEEYVRPARLVEHGRIVVREALSEPELVDFEGLGTLEAFNTDGLRSLADTLDVPFMRERTMRYPGHIELMRVLRDTGFFSRDEIEVGTARIRPLDLTAALLFPKWSFGPGEADLTVMRVEAVGRREGRPVRMTWELFDRYDPETSYRSMSRTTAFPATIMAGLIARGRYRRPGVVPPEIPGREQPELLATMLAELRTRGVCYTVRIEPLEATG